MAKTKSNADQFLSPIGERVLNGIDRGLEGFGENVAEVFYQEMEKYYNFDRKKILEHPDEFVGAISKFFTVGSSLVERSIGREILKIFEIPVCPSLDFKTAVEIVKRHPSVKALLAQ